MKVLQGLRCRGDSLASVLAVALTATCLAAIGPLALAGTRPSGIVMTVAIAFLPYGFMVYRGRAGALPGPWWTSLVVAGVVGLTMVVAPTVLSDDLFRYLWDARVLRHGVDPYRHAPADPALAGLRDALHGRINHPSIPTIYPPVAQGVFAMADAVAHAPWSMKLFALLAHLGTAAVVHRVAAGRVGGAAWIYALNPLALEEAALGGHVDAVAALCVAGFAWAMTGTRWLLAALMAGLASGVKLVGLALAPLLVGRSRGATVLALVLAVLPLIPLAGAGWGSQSDSGLVHYSRRWSGNAGAFALLEASAEGVVSGLGRWTGASQGHVRLEPLRPWLEWAEGTPWDPRSGALAEKKGRGDIVDFEAAYVAGLLARALAVLLVLALAVFLGLRRTEPLLAARWVVLALLLLAPQVHPWYLLWLLPLEVAAGRVAGLVWSAAVLVAYAPLDDWIVAGRWVEPVAGRLLEYGLLALVIAVEELPVPIRSRTGEAVQ